MLRRTLIRELAAWGIVGATICVVFAYFSNYFHSYFRGPFYPNAAELLDLKDPSRTNRAFVQVTGTKTIETGLQQITVSRRHGTETGRWVSADYYALLVGPKYLLVKSPSGSPLSIQGELDKIPSDLHERLFPTPQQKATADQAFYPYYLDGTSDFKTPGHWFVGISAIVVAYGLWRVYWAWGQLENLLGTPLIKRISTWGNLNTVSAQIEAEFNQVGPKWGSWWAKRDFIIRSDFFDFDVLRLDDLLWAYKKVTTHKTNFRETGKSYGIMLHCYGGSAELSGTEAQMANLLELLTDRAPWSIFGYSDEILQVWNKKNKEFCQEVEKRRATSQPRL